MLDLTRPDPQTPPSEEDQHKTDQKRKHGHGWREFREWTRLVVEVITLIAVIGYASIAYRQLNEMRETNNLTRVAQGRTQEAIVDADRPWVGVDTMDAINVVVGQKAEARWSVLNSGKSPATHLTMRMNVGLFRGRPVDRPSDLPLIQEPVQGAIFPNQRMTINVALPDVLSDDELKRINSGVDTFISWGTIQYLDRINRQHETTICAIYKPGTYRPPILGNFEPCAKGNSAT